MRIRWEEIPADGLSFEITDQSWLPREELSCQGETRCSIALEKMEDGRVRLAGSFCLTVLLACDRCLDPFPCELSDEFEMILELALPGATASDAVARGGEVTDPDVISLAEPVVEIFPLLAEQVYLALPGKRLCGDDCAGLCLGCGVNRNREACACADRQTASPFAALAALKVQ